MNAPIVEPYLFFEGSCDAAIAFYQEAIGAEVLMLMRFKDNPDAESCGGGDPEKVMHATLRIGATNVMISDGMCSGTSSFQGFSLSLSLPSVEEAERKFAALADGGKVQMPLGKTFFSHSFGMVADKFGVCWMIIVPMEMPHA